MFGKHDPESMKISEGLRYTLKSAHSGYPDQVESIKNLEPDSSDLQSRKVAFGVGGIVLIGGAIAGLAYSVPQEISALHNANANFQEAEFPNGEDTTTFLTQGSLIAVESLFLAHGFAYRKTAHAAAKRQSE